MTEDNVVPYNPVTATGNDILTDVYAFLGRFVAYPSEAAQVAHTLWIAHTHLMDWWDSTPRIAFLSPEPGSGKSRALEVSALLVPRPLDAINVSPAYVFHKLAEDELPTILHDEIDTVFGPRAPDNEGMRGMINAGHRRSGTYGRCVVHGKKIETQDIPAFCAVAMAGLGSLPDTILSRSVVIGMRRRAPSETVEPFRPRKHEREGYELRDRLTEWAEAIADDMDWPSMPPGIEDRDADVWEALIMVADAAGKDWPDRGRRAAVSLVTQAKESTPSLGIRLRADIRDVFEETESLSTVDLIRMLIDLDESPWGNLKGKPLDARGLSFRLRQYEVKPKQIRIGAWTGKGYDRTDFHDAWERYLPPLSPETETTETRETAVTAGSVSGVTDVSDFPTNGDDAVMDWIKGTSS